MNAASSVDPTLQTRLGQVTNSMHFSTEIDQVASRSIPRNLVGTSQILQFVDVKKFEDLPENLLRTAVSVYQAAFSIEPYCEFFEDSEVIASLQNVLDKRGDLILGVKQEQTVALAGGFPIDDVTYFIDELAVDLGQQRQGYGRGTLKELLNTIQQRNFSRTEIRTTVKNTKAIGLYKSEGFVQEHGTVVVSQIRQDGKVGLDERVYLSKPMLSDDERLMTIKHLAIVYPSGNTTAVIFDQLLDSDRKQLNHKIMSSWKTKQPDSPEVEQCCFVTLPKNPDAIARVEMFGGEFCGNATRSVVWLITQGKDSEGLIEVSGVSKPLNFNVQNGMVTISMPLPANETLVETVEEGTLVHLDGITHLVVLNNHTKTEPRDLLDSLIKSNKYNCSSYPAFGVSYFDSDTSKAQFCVWVKHVDTIFDETACGSGTCSIGIALAEANKQTTEQGVVQPSEEEIYTRAVYDPAENKTIESSISGKVKALYDGEFKFG